MLPENRKYHGLVLCPGCYPIIVPPDVFVSLTWDEALWAVKEGYDIVYHIGDDTPAEGTLQYSIDNKCNIVTRDAEYLDVKGYGGLIDAWRAKEDTDTILIVRGNFPLSKYIEEELVQDMQNSFAKAGVRYVQVGDAV